MAKEMKLNRKILDLNEKYAAKNSEFFAARNINCFNVISSPGAGKTTLLYHTIKTISEAISPSVIVGDIATDLDAAKLKNTGVPAIQINTEGACHLTAKQVNDALLELNDHAPDMVFIENVGNLVCPSAFQLGETGKVTILSTAEGDDKPAKYPGSFANSLALVISKIDLLETGAVDFDVDKVISQVKKLNNDIAIFQVSSKLGQGIEPWCSWLLENSKR